MIITTYDDNGLVLGAKTEDKDYILKSNETNLLCVEKFLITKFNGTEYYEGANPQEIQEQQIKQALVLETEKYKQRQADGVQMYAEISAEFRLAKLNGLMSESTQSAIERILIPVRNEVLAGQWISAKNELEFIGNSNVGADLYNRLHNQISNYITENY